MAQHDMDVANGSGATVRADINSALQALATCFSGDSAPGTTFAYMWWADTANNLLKQRNAANSAWISVLTLSTGKAVSAASADAVVAGGVNQAAIAANVVGKGPAFIAGMSAGQVVTNGATQIATFNNEINDTNGNYNPATFRFTPNVPGYYLVSASIASADSATGYTIVMVYKNSGSVARSKVKNINGQPLVAPATTLVYMNGSTDYLTCNIYQDCGASTTCGGPSIEQANFSAVLVRSA